MEGNKALELVSDGVKYSEQNQMVWCLCFFYGKRRSASFVFNLSDKRRAAIPALKPCPLSPAAVQILRSNAIKQNPRQQSDITSLKKKLLKALGVFLPFESCAGVVIRHQRAGGRTPREVQLPGASQQGTSQQHQRAPTRRRLCSQQREARCETPLFTHTPTPRRRRGAR